MRAASLGSAAAFSSPAACPVGDACWRAELLRCRGAEPAAWTVEAYDETRRLRLASDLADRPAETDGRQASRRQTRCEVDLVCTEFDLLAVEQTLWEEEEPA